MIKLVILCIGLCILGNNVESQQMQLPQYGQPMYPDVKTEIIDVADNQNNQASGLSPYISPYEIQGMPQRYSVPMIQNEGLPRLPYVQGIPGQVPQLSQPNMAQQYPVIQPYGMPSEAVPIYNLEPRSTAPQENVKVSSTDELSPQNLSAPIPLQYPTYPHNGYPYNGYPYNGYPYYPSNPYPYGPYYNNYSPYGSLYSNCCYRSPYQYCYCPQRYPYVFHHQSLPGSNDINMVSNGINTVNGITPPILQPIKRNEPTPNNGPNIIINGIPPRNDVFSTAPGNAKQFNYTSTGGFQRYVSHVELKPVSTIMTRYSGRDGKTHVKTTITDPSGNTTTTTSEHDGPIDLNIAEGVVRKSGENSESTVAQKAKIKIVVDSKPDPNSIPRNPIVPNFSEIVKMPIKPEDEEEEEEEEKDEEPEETEVPIDVRSWFL